LQYYVAKCIVVSIMSMEDYGKVLDNETLDKPLLIFKIGVLGCATLDFPVALADRYDAELLSSDYIRKSVLDNRRAQGNNSLKVDIRRIREIMGAQAEPLLTNDSDVVLDMFINGTKSREFPIDLARRTGALTLALWINTPFKKALARVEQWTEDDAFVIPISQWEV
jgi:predicted kinase